MHHPPFVQPCVTVKTTAPVASQAPSPLLDLCLFLFASAISSTLLAVSCLLHLLDPDQFLLTVTFFLYQCFVVALVQRYIGTTYKLVQSVRKTTLQHFRDKHYYECISKHLPDGCCPDTEKGSIIVSRLIKKQNKTSKCLLKHFCPCFLQPTCNFLSRTSRP